MMKLASKFWPALGLKLWKDERGQSTTEYILMLAVVVMIAMKFKKTFLQQMDGIVGSVSNNIKEVVEQQ